MDGDRFDLWARSLATKRSRRASLRAVLGGGVALLATRLGLPGVAAQTPIPQGEACFDASQCAPGLDCAWNGFGSAGAACCVYVGGPCADDFGCCGAASCFGGVCADVTSAPTHGDPCQPGGNPCVYASGGFTCDYVSWTGDYRCCTYEGERCSWNGECCGDNLCVDGVCRAQAGGSNMGAGGPCTWAGCPCVLWRDPECRASCELNDPCDPGLYCTGDAENVGTCVPAW